MHRIARRVAVAVLALAAVVAVQPAFAGTASCSGDATSTLATRSGLSPSVIAAHGGTTSGAVNKLIADVCAATQSAPTAAAAAMQAANYAPTDIGDVLEGGFGQTVLESAGIFAYLGFDASEIASMLLGSTRRRRSKARRS